MVMRTGRVSCCLTKKRKEMRGKYLPLILVLFFPAILRAQFQIIHFKDLEEYLPKDDYETYVRGKPTGETSSMMGFATSWAQVNYVVPADSSNGRISVKITDMLNLPSYVSMLGDVDKKTENGYERTVFYDGLKVLESFDGVDRQGKLQFPVANRFLIEITGYDILNTRPLYGLLDRTDIAGLVNLVGSAGGRKK